MKRRNGGADWVYSVLPINTALGPVGSFVQLYIVVLHGTVIDISLATTLFNAVRIPAAIVWGYATDHSQNGKPRGQNPGGRTASSSEVTGVPLAIEGDTFVGFLLGLARTIFLRGGGIHPARGGVHPSLNAYSSQHIRTGRNVTFPTGGQARDT